MATRSFARRASAILLVSGCLLFSSAQAGDVFDGKTLYERHCQDCHGASGEGAMPGMANFTRGEGLMVTNRQLADTIRGGMGVMPAYGGLLEEEQILNIVAYLRTLL